MNSVEQSLPSEELHQAHLDTDIQDVTHPCEQCGTAFTSEELLQAHLDTHIQGVTLPCEQCGTVFTSEELLQAHLDTHIQGVTLPCEQCGTVFTSKGLLQAHLDTHTQGVTLVCEQCGTVFTSKGLLQGHLETHNGVSTFLCEQCWTAITSKELLQKHLDTSVVMHDDEAMDTVCEDVRQAVESTMEKRSSDPKEELTTHTDEFDMGEEYEIAKHTGDESAMETSSHLKEHQASQINESPFECEMGDECKSVGPADDSTEGEAFSHLKEHLTAHSSDATHHGESKLSMRLNNVIPTKMTMPQSNMPTKRGRTGSLKCHLKTHIKPRFQKSGSNLHGKLFPHLKGHQTSHCNDLTYECDVCGRKFRRRIQMHKTSLLWKR